MLAGIYANHQVDKRGNLTLAGFLSCVYEQTVENEAAIVWELQQLGYGSREAASGPGSGSIAASGAVASPATDGTNVAAPNSAAEPAVIEPTAPALAPAPATDTSATRSKTKSALLGGLRSGKLEDAVAKMEADEAAATAAAAEAQADAEQLADLKKDDAGGMTARSDDPAPALAAEAEDERKRREQEEAAAVAAAEQEQEQEEEAVGSDDDKFGFDRGSDEDFEFD